MSRAASRMSQAGRFPKNVVERVFRGGLLVSRPSARSCPGRCLLIAAMPQAVRTAAVRQGSSGATLFRPDDWARGARYLPATAHLSQG